MKRLLYVMLLASGCFTTVMGQSMTDNDILNANLDRLIKQAKNRGSIQSGDNSLVAYYPFNSNCKDESGKGNHGQTIGSASFVEYELNGEKNTCCSLGGVRNPGCIKVPNSSSLSIGDGWTFSAFVQFQKTEAMDGWGSTVADGGASTIFAKRHDRSGFVIFGSLKNGKFNTWMGGTVSGVSASLEGVSVKQWIHVAYTYSKGVFRVYLNGELKSKKEISPSFGEANRNEMYLGKFSDKWYPLCGYIDEVRIYNRGLSDEEIAILAEM